MSFNCYDYVTNSEQIRNDLNGLDRIIFVIVKYNKERYDKNNSK